MADQVQVDIFKKALSLVLPRAIPVDCDKAAQFEIGRVLVYAKKPKAFARRGAHVLEFARDDTGHPISLVDLLLREDRQQLDASKVNKSRRFYANQERQEWETLVADLGSVFEVSSNLRQLLDAHKLKADLDHPAVKKAIESGGVLPVISTVYQSDKVDIQSGQATGEGDEIRWKPGMCMVD